MTKKQLRVGMIGYGFMGRAHSNAYKQVGQFFPSGYEVVLKAACARNAEQIKKFAEQWGYESTETDWRKLVARPDIDVIDICTPNNMHKEIALAAAANKKAILCEKPLAMNTAEGREMIAAVEKAGVPNMVWYNYRRIPAVTLAKKLIEEGNLAASSTIAPSSSRTGPSKPTSRKAGRGCGVSMSPRPAPVFPATFWPTASTPRSG